MADYETMLARFQREAESFARDWLGESARLDSERRYNFLQIRIWIASGSFIELYYNAQNGRASYALIHREKRIFGYDGVKEWHRHPLENPDAHVPCTKPRLTQVLREMRQVIESLTRRENNV